MGILRAPYRTMSSPNALIGDPRLRIAGMTISFAVTIAFVSYFFLFLLFSHRLRIQNEELEGKRVRLNEARLLIARRLDYEKDWESKKSTLPSNFSEDQLLNLWVKDLLSFASSEGITFGKLEPQGMKEKEIRLYLEFQGDVRKLIRFLYFLNEKDLLSRMDSLAIKKEEGSKGFSYQLTLGKILL